MRNALIGGGLALVAVAAGCMSLNYYFQALDGQMELTRKARAIPEVLTDPTTPRDLKAKLERVQQIRAFASADLGLPDNGTYRRYADIGRPFVVWNVFAAPELSVHPKQWCFPIAGCVNYRGYFRKESAEAFAAELQGEGYDVFVGGVPAYSTLGWFDDPVLSTFVRFPETETARLIFHELAHQVVYIQGDSTFNESFATTVELEGVKRWLERYGTPAQQDAFEQAQARKRQFSELATDTRAKLAEVYAGARSPPEKRAAKAEILEQMRARYAVLKQSWGGFSGYDWWFEQPLNNAQVASVAIYTQFVPGFQRLLAQEGGDLQRFYAETKKVAQQSKAKRDALLSEDGSKASRYVVEDQPG